MQGPICESRLEPHVTRLHSTNNDNVDIIATSKVKRRAGYNLSSTCCGLDILRPCCSQLAIFLPSIRGYGEPPGKENFTEKTSCSRSRLLLK